MHPEHLKDLRPAEAVPEVFAVHQSVWDAIITLATLYHTYGEDIHRVCHLCGQSMYVHSRAGIEYPYAVGDTQGLVFTHMAQAHGWDRETVGDV